MENEERGVQTEPKNETPVGTSKNKKILREVIDWAIWIIGALVLSFILSRYVIVNANVPTGSMISTIMPDDRLIGFRLAYVFSEPKRGDIIIFPYPDDETVPYVKRLIGLPGETVEIHDGKVFVDGTVIDEPYLSVVTEGTYGPYEVPEGMYFFLGDNRNLSKDSRFWANKYVPKDKLIGKVLFRYYPSFSNLTKSK